MQTLGQRIAALRAEKNMKQNELAEKLGVSAQAVSKWENDISCPDISMLPSLAAVLGVSVDALLSGEEQVPEVRLASEEEQRKKADARVFRISVDSGDGDRVRVNLPLPLVKMGLELGMGVPQITGSDALKSIDMAQVMKLVDQGLVGRLVELDSGDGDHVEIVVE